MNVDQRIFYQRHTPKGDLTILLTEADNLPTDTAHGGATSPYIPLNAEHVD